ncbi:hypothetical protein L0B53_14895 [Vibrio sp. SS-MA-C1-2]|uniref:hypothetical protein n=1 Tax=Vibrio sp. SS-MA-C1-2 TaxID=2908646 RepID=UPI001F414632|nr:hypothetical protein [Vibrio sp. SS-MA-C1-2]UJF18295.1 hypothetical protein L0B53_14895 [Vibrio sp. SS-MA-C1-2]
MKISRFTVEALFSLLSVLVVLLSTNTTHQPFAPIALVYGLLSAIFSLIIFVLIENIKLSIILFVFLISKLLYSFYHYISFGDQPFLIGFTIGFFYCLALYLSANDKMKRVKIDKYSNEKLA